MLVMGTSYAQSVGNMPDENKAIVIVNRKYGAIDKSGRYIVQPEYDKLFPFYNGFATFRQGDKFGILDSTGTVVLPPTYDSIGNNSEGFTQFWSNGKMGFVNNEGDIVIRPIYTSGEAIINGMAPVHINTSLGEKAGVIDNKGKFIVRPVYFNTYRSWKKTDPPIVFLYDKETEHHAFVNHYGEVVELGDLDVSEFITDSLLIVSYDYDDGYNRESMYGIIDIHGKIIKPIEYDHIGSFQYKPSVKYIVLSKYNGLSREYGPWSIVDINFSPIVPERIANKITNNYWKGHANVRIYSGEDIARCYRNGLLGPMRIEPNDCNVFLNRNGEIAFHTNYINVSVFREGLAFVERQYTVDGGIDRPCVDPHNEFFYAHEWESKYGYIDTTGHLVLECKYDDATNFRHGVSEVSINREKRYINKKGRVIDIDAVVGHSEGLTLVRKNDLYGYIDEQGDIIIPIKYICATLFINGIARVIEDYGDQMGCIDKKGKMIIAPQFDFIYPFGAIRENNYFEYYDYYDYKYEENECVNKYYDE